MKETQKEIFAKLFEKVKEQAMAEPTEKKCEQRFYDGMFYRPRQVRRK